MDHRRFDALTRALSTSGSRRALSALLGGGLGLLTLGSAASDVAEARKKRRHKGRGRERRTKVKAEGPCGNGKPKKNRCKRDRQCCTGYCKKRRCRCRQEGRSCTEDRNCCSERTGRTCVEGRCQPATTCDVCAAGCPFSSVRDAIAAAGENATIRICAGTYQETETIVISQSLTLLGAGDGEDGAILHGQDQRRVVLVNASVTDVFLEGLRITGGNADEGGGIFCASSELTLTGCTVIGNTASGRGGGIANVSGTITLIDSTVRGNTAGATVPDSGGGVFTSDGLANLGAGSHVCGNVPDQCAGIGINDPNGACQDVCPV